MLGLLVVTGGAWRFMDGKTLARGARQVTAPVRTARVERRDMPVVEHTLGRVVANAMVQVTARVQGSLEQAFFHERQFVTNGQLLFQIDPRPFKATLAQAQAVLRRDEALLKNANLDKQRYETLFRQNSTSLQQRDTSLTNAEVLAATVAADHAAVQLAALDLNYTQIRAPIDGKTGPILVQPGNTVTASGTTALVTIAQIRPIKLSFNLSEADLPRIQARLRSHSIMATIDPTDARRAPLAAPVDFVSNVVNDQSGTVELRASFPNTDLSLLPGQLVNTTVELNDIPHALVVPSNAVNDGPDGRYVLVVVNDRAMQRNVSVLFDDTHHVAIEGDVKPGDQVIVEGQLRVNPGGPVQVIPAASQPIDAEGAG
ncbi:MAG: efflux RND transporter periplasmic adaptor subunit [Steroidobacteraceae bacterium]